MKYCGGYTRLSKTIVVWCDQPATLECVYLEGWSYRHYRCAAHPPPPGEYAIVRPLVDGQLPLFAGAK